MGEVTYRGAVGLSGALPWCAVLLIGPGEERGGGGQVPGRSRGLGQLFSGHGLPPLNHSAREGSQVRSHA